MKMLKLKYLWLILPFLAMGCEDDDDVNADRLAVSHKTYGIPAKGGDFTLLVSSSVKYSVDYKSDWLVMTDEEGDRYSFTAGENTDYNVRLTEILVRALDKAITDTVRVYQVGKEGLFLDAAERAKTIDPTGGEVEVQVNFTNAGFRVKPEVEWITYVPTKAMGLEQKTIVLNVEANIDYSHRVGKVIIVSKDGMFSDTVTITQSEKQGMMLDQQSITVESEGALLKVGYRQNVGHASAVIAEEYRHWISEVPAVRSLTRDTLSLQIGENEEPTPRVAIIPIKVGEEYVDTLTLTQEAALPKVVDNGDGTFTVYPAADLAAVIAEANGETYYMTEGEYTLSKAAEIKAGIKMIAKDGAEVTVHMVQFDITGDASAITFDGIHFVGPGADQGKYFIAQSGAQEGIVEKVEIKNCKISNFKNSLLRTQNKNAGVKEVVVDHCVITDVRGANDFLRNASASLPMNITFTNSTVVNITDGNFINATASDGAVIVIKNNTIYGLNKSGKYVVDANNKQNTVVTVEKNIFGITDYKGVRVPQQTLKDNCLVGSFAAEWKNDQGTLTDDPQFKDAANGDFTVQNATVKAAGVGDPRWLK